MPEPNNDEKTYNFVTDGDKLKSQKTIHDILQEFRDAATSNRDLGDRFERLIFRYLQLDPLYADRFSQIWMWNDWPLKGKVGDVGADLVALEQATGEYCAIQCKFFLPDHTIVKEDIDSFFTVAGKTQFSSCMIVSTTDKWSKNAEHALQNQSKPVFRLRVQDLDASPVDWSKFSLERPQDIGLRARKTLMEHQKAALLDVSEGLKKADRGKLIMACGTGKTFTSLKIAEQMAPSGTILFLVPSISLLSQSLREWTAEASLPMHTLAVCSDTKVGKRSSKNEEDGTDILIYDLAFPATTSAKEIIRQHHALHEKAKKTSQGMTVVFSTYQSIAAVAGAQKAGFPEFDLIVCDEAHRTTGVTLSGEDESHFVKVHDNGFIKGRKRLYMTATPRIYGDESKVKAKEASAEVCSMDDQKLFGEELHRLGFGEGVGRGLLADYKVLVLAVDEKYVSKTFQRLIADQGNELKLDDAVKIMGCWNGLAKRVGQVTDEASDFQGDLTPMRRAVAFSRGIKDSRAFVERFSKIIEDYRAQHPDEEGRLSCELAHVDGTFDSLRRGELLDWLKASHESSACRILSNARCLSEGVDVPALDAVIFLNPRNSMVDVVQSVGRVMRRAEGKKYGYIILPIGIPADVSPEEALKDNDKYKVVWQVLQALRAHDDRFNAQVNHIELNKKRPESIQVIGVGEEYPEKASGEPPSVRERQFAFEFPQLEEWKDAIYARVVLKCGDRQYWENWAKDVAQIADRHSTRIKALLKDGDARQTKAFTAFLEGLRKNINPSISESDAIEMLSQHLITKPVFDALFEGYAFTHHNPVSKAMQRMINALEDQSLEKETATLDKFYASVRTRVTGVTNPEGKQKVVVELYDKFFRAAFPKMAERLGIVYTPVELVDFILRSVADVLKDEFGATLSDKDVHIIDPFTGTGTFLVRLLQSDLIRPEDIKRKYLTELHANEIVLLAYYIAAINIEEAFHGLVEAKSLSINGPKETPARTAYTPFDGIVLTDTFQLSESKGDMEEKLFSENNQRLKRQKQSSIRVVLGNPPYSAGQDSENDSNKALKYPNLDERIRSTYADSSSATLVKNLYDSYIRAIRWASDRIQDQGVIGYVTNNSFIDGNNMDGLRACLAKEFSSIYIFNLRGNQRTSGELSRMEGGKIFGSGSRAGIAISLFVRNPNKTRECDIHYHDIGDYLDREKKLTMIQEFKSISGIRNEGKLKRIQPNSSHDWINQRDPAFKKFIPLGDKKDDDAKTIFDLHSQGALTSRDKWCYNFSRAAIETNMRSMIAFYNDQLDWLARASRGKTKVEISHLIEKSLNTDPRNISWSGNLKGDLEKLERHQFKKECLVVSVYRPFSKQWLYHSRDFNERVYQLPRIFPKPGLDNTVIAVSGIGASKGFSALITSVIPNFHMHDTGQCFPLFIYEKDDPRSGELIGGTADGELIGNHRRKSAISRAALADFRAAFGPTVSNEDIFYYVYGVLHSSEYRERFANDLKKMLPRIPMTKEVATFLGFCQAGRDLARWHINYETVEPYPLTEESSELALDPKKHFLVTKMTFSRKNREIDKTRIIYNNHLSLSGIPSEAYEYIVNGKPAIEWIMERYQVTTDQESGIRNDPNDWAKETKQPRYIVDLIRRIVRVSIETMKIVKALPTLNERR